MKRTNKQFIRLIETIVVMVLLAMAIGANAQIASGSATQSARLNLSDAIELTFVSGNSTVNVAFNNASDLQNGVETGSQSIKVRSNKKFKVAVSTSSSNFTYSGTSIVNNLIPVNTGLKVKVVSNNTGGNLTLLGLLGYLGLTFGSSTTLLTNCDPGGNQTFAVQYKATPGILAAPGTYTAEVVFTATQL